ncbi:NADH dehydrogenase component NdhF [Populus alba x Populus x berolinensis]|nr:NADH dehydrogenase component NdhF [Populus alba x Populus x berolinensis]
MLNKKRSRRWSHQDAIGRPCSILLVSLAETRASIVADGTKMTSGMALINPNCGTFSPALLAAMAAGGVDSPMIKVHFLFVTLCAFLLFSGTIVNSAQFPLHVRLPDAMEGSAPISTLIHAATMVAAGIFLIARLLPLFIVIPYIMKLIAFIGIITILLGATLAFVQKDIKRGLAYSTMSQLGYTMLALGMGSYRAALFHLITHAYSKALLFLRSGSIIHSMEGIVGYSPDKSQNMEPFLFVVFYLSPVFGQKMKFLMIDGRIQLF